MKKVLSVIFFALPLLVYSQGRDTLFLSQIDSLIEASRTYTGEGDLQKAMALNLVAEELALTNFGKVSIAFANTCFNHGRVLHFEGELADATQWYLDGLGIYKQMEQGGQTGWARTVFNLTFIYRSDGDLLPPDFFYQEARALQENLGNHFDKDIGNCFFYVADILSEKSWYELAEPFYLAALDQFKMVFGEDHAKYTGCQNDLGLLYLEMGQYRRAEALYRSLLQTQREHLGIDDPQYASSLHNLANLYLLMGSYDQAEPLYRESLAIWERDPGKEDPRYAMCLNNLATLYNQTGNYAQAEPLYQEGLQLTSSFLGKRHQDYAFVLGQQGILYRRQGRYEEAESDFLQAIEIYKESLGTENQYYAACIGNLANLYAHQGLYEAAEPLFLECMAIREKTLGPNHPEYLTGLRSLAELYYWKGESEKAVSYFQQADTLQRSLLAKAVHHLSERELDRYQRIYEDQQAKLFSFAGQYNGGDNLIAAVCYDNALFHKGFLLQASSEIKTLALSDDLASEKYQQLRSLQRELAAEYSRSIDHQQEVRRLEEKANALEKELASLVAGFGEALQQVKWSDVRQQLQPGEAAIEFVHFPYTEKEPTDKTLYAALLIRPESPQPGFIPLFGQSLLDQLLSAHIVRKADYVNQLYSLPDRGLQPVSPDSVRSKTLYQLIWEPLMEELTGVQTIYFSSTGYLHRLNLGAVPLPVQKENPWSAQPTMADRFQLIQLGSTRKLVLAPRVRTQTREVVLFGGVNYDADSTASAGDFPEAEQALAMRSEGALPLLIDSTLRSGSSYSPEWHYLRWTETEVNTLEPILGQAGFSTTTLRGGQASEEFFKTLGTTSPSPQVLHLATHGFFFPDPERSQDIESQVFKQSEHPMIRSGLVLAGANPAWQGNPDPYRKEDGILTAYEISQVDLSNTELVVLSACETGLGDIHGNEGVYGLQRAFKIAGAKYLIMSLWQVPDQETALFMVTFYQNWLGGDRSIPEAFRLTQKAMQERFINPYQWAGFVLVE